MKRIFSHRLGGLLLVVVVLGVGVYAAFLAGCDISSSIQRVALARELRTRQSVAATLVASPEGTLAPSATATATPTSMPTTVPTATASPTPVPLNRFLCNVGLPEERQVGDWRFTLERADVYSVLPAGEDELSPKNGVYLVLAGTVYNSGAASGCLARGEWQLLDNITGQVLTVDASAMLRADAQAGVVYPGIFAGICLEPGQADRLYLIFDVPVGSDLFLSFRGELGGEALYVGALQIITPTPTPSATATATTAATPTTATTAAPTATATATPTATAIAAATAAVTAGATQTLTSTLAPKVTPSPTATSAPTPASSATASASASGGVMSATVQTVALHLRAQPSIEAQIRAWLEKDQELQIVGRNADGRWLRCNTEDGVSGWVFTAHVILDGALEDLPVVE